LTPFRFHPALVVISLAVASLGGCRSAKERRCALLATAVEGHAYQGALQSVVRTDEIFKKRPPPPKERAALVAHRDKMKRLARATPATKARVRRALIAACRDRLTALERYCIEVRLLKRENREKVQCEPVLPKLMQAAVEAAAGGAR
jgi:hypothetical protein